MCGLVGIFSWRAGIRLDEAVLVAMRDEMVPRGPDDAGVLVHRGRHIAAGFAHRRLSIVDLSPRGHQPMSSADGRLTLVYNGEIFNFISLRETLEAHHGHQFQSGSDTEVVLHAVQEWGLEGALRRFRGMYAFALLDRRDESLTLVRDPLGVKPLYYREDRGSLLFASEIKALLAHPDVAPALDPGSLAHYLTFANSPAPQTMFQGIRKLEAGTYLTVDSCGRLQQKRYWNSASITPVPVANEADCIEQLRGLLRQSVARRMVSDVPFGVFLSGGVDSSLNVALMAALMERPVVTYSVGIRGDASNEFEHARAVAQRFGTQHHEIQIGNEHFLRFFERMAYIQDEPLADPVCVPLYYLSKLARETGTRVIQVGEGSDEIFGGYGMYHRFNAWNRLAFDPYSRLPSFARQAMYKLSRRFGSPALHDAGRRAAQREPLFIGNSVAFWDSKKAQLLREPPSPAASSSRFIRDLAETLRVRDPLLAMINVELRNRLPELLLMRVDKVTMANSIESRVPFLDEDVVEFALALPSSMKLRNGVAKYALKKAAEGLLPDEIIYRKKHGFCGSATSMLNPTLAAYARDVVMHSPLIRELCHGSYVEGLFRRFAQQPRFNSFKIWNLLNLALWHDTWFRARRTAAAA